MRPKYQGILTMLLALAALGAISAYAGSGIWRTEVAAQAPLRPQPGVQMPSDHDLAAIRTLAPKLPSLAVPASRPKDPLLLSLFGQQPYGSVAGFDEAGSDFQDHGDQEMAYGLSMTLLSGATRYCVIDGELVTEGARLADGATVVKIGDQKVLIARQQNMQWISLREESQASDPNSQNEGKGQS